MNLYNIKLNFYYHEIYIINFIFYINFFLFLIEKYSFN